jgi:hypothetical protein
MDTIIMDNIIDTIVMDNIVIVSNCNVDYDYG